MVECLLPGSASSAKAHWSDHGPGLCFSSTIYYLVQKQNLLSATLAALSAANAGLLMTFLPYGQSRFLQGYIYSAELIKRLLNGACRDE